MTRYRQKTIVVAAVFTIASLTASFGFSLLHSGPPETRHPSEPGILVRAIVVPFLFLAGARVVTVPATTLACILLIVSLVKDRLWWLSIIGFSVLELLWLPAAWFASVVPLD